MSEALYSETWVQIKLGDRGHISRKIYTHDGLKQGCVLATGLFNLNMSDFDEHLNEVTSTSLKLANVKIKTYNMPTSF